MMTTQRVGYLSTASRITFGWLVSLKNTSRLWSVFLLQQTFQTLTKAIKILSIDFLFWHGS